MKKPCANCGKRIPRAAPECSFCGERQPQSGPPPPWASGEHEVRPSPALLVHPEAVSVGEGPPELAPVPPTAVAPWAPAALERPQGADGAPDGADGRSSRRSPPPALVLPEGGAGDIYPAPGVPIFEAEPASLDEDPAPRLPPARPAPPSLAVVLSEGAVPFQGRTRFLHFASGVLLLVLFCLPWHGARSWELLRYLQGGDFVRQLTLLVGGAVLVSTGLLPVPAGFRAAVGALIGLTFLASGGVLLSLVQRLLGVLVVVLLPAVLLVRTQQKRARLPRLLGLMAVLALLSLYIVPRDGVAPIRVAVDLVYYQKDEMARFIGTYLLIPLPLVALATVALLGADVAVIGELLGWLILCWGPGALLVLAIDNTQVYMASAVLCAAACAAYGVAELLRRITKTVEAER